ncbi:MAG: peptidylprolyl isomerase [Verrucomicrobia bacterium]|nr:peptidylprolyl isomerase [Verrucomicrobiota bacterium]
MTSKTWKQILAVACGLAGTVVFAQTQPAAPTTAPANPDEAVAKVNGKAITRRQLGDVMASDMRMLAQRGTQLTPDQQLGYERQVVGKLIDQELLIQAASKTQVPDVDKKVDDQIAKIKASFPDPKMFDEQLQKMGRSAEQVRADIRQMLTVQAFVEAEFAGKVKIGDDQIKAFYDEHPDYFSKPAQIRASHILVSVPQDATDEVKKTKRTVIDKARARVTTGKEDFAKVAAEISECPSKTKGGDLEFFGKGQMVPEFDQAAFALKGDEISDVVATQFGFHIIKKTGEQPAEKRPLDTMKESIEKFLKKQQVDKQLAQFIEDQKKTAKIESLLK